MLEIVNPCNTCARKCCKEFKVTVEITNPQKMMHILQKFKFIKHVGSDVVLLSGREKVVGIYACDRFNESTGLCENYDTLERPEFCYNTGRKFAPQADCKFFKTNN